MLTQKTKKFAFLVHPRNEISQDMARVVKPLGLIPNELWSLALKHLPIPGFNLGNTRLQGSDEIAGFTLILPITPNQLLEPSTRARRHAQQVIHRGIDQARLLGAEIIGLGALTSSVTQGGKALAKRKDVVLTNGNAFTAHITMKAIERLLRKCPENMTISVVGASGSIGSVVVEMLSQHLAEYFPAARLNLIARNQRRLAPIVSSAKASFNSKQVASYSDLTPMPQSDLIILLTSSSDAILKSEHLKKNAIVLDDTQPRNTDPNLVKERPDVLIVDGGLVQLRNINIGADFGLPKDIAFACFAETMLMGLAGASEHVSIGAPDIKTVGFVARTAEQFQEYGFTLADFHSFGRPLRTSQATRSLGPIFPRITVGA